MDRLAWGVIYFTSPLWLNLFFFQFSGFYLLFCGFTIFLGVVLNIDLIILFVLSVTGLLIFTIFSGGGKSEVLLF